MQLQSELPCALLCRCAAKAESLHQLRRTLGEYAREKRPNAPSTGLMPVSLRNAADVANTLARQPDAALMDVWGLDAMAVQYMLMDSINRVRVHCKASRRQLLVQQRLGLCRSTAFCLMHSCATGVFEQ